MKKILRAFILGALFGVALFFIWRSTLEVEAENTRPITARLEIRTPKKKAGGIPTVVQFNHQRHAEQATCKACHPPLDPTLNSAKNTMINVHKICTTCHKPKGSAVKFSSCNDCHIKPATS